jgi:hypothetical protein
MIHNYTKFLMLVIVLMLVQNMDLTFKKLKKLSQVPQTSFAQLEIQKLPDGSWFLLRSVHSDMCLTWGSDRVTKQTACNSKQLNQLWKIKKIQEKQGDWIKISNINGDFLDNKGGEKKRKSKYGISSENKSDTQNFLAEIRDSGFTLKNERGAKCIVPTNLDDGSLIQQKRCCGSNQTQWKLEKVNYTPNPTPNKRESTSKPNAQPIPQPIPQPIAKPAVNPTVQPIIKPAPQPLMREVTPQVSAKVPLNTPVFIRNKQTGRCLTAEINTGKRYHLSVCNPSNINQKFTVRPYQGDFNRVFAHNPAFVFDLNGQGEQDGNYYHNWPVNNTPAQHFKMPSVDGKYFKLINQRSNKCAANPQGDVIDQRGCNNNDNQLFNFDPVDSFVISKPAVNPTVQPVIKPAPQPIAKPAVNPTVQPIIKPAPQPLMREVTPQVSAKVPLNTPVFIRNKQTGRCLTAEINTGKRYHLSVCNPSNINQKFTVRPYQGDFNRVFAHNPAFVFDLNGQGEHDGNYYHNWPVNNTPAQHFKMPSVDGKYFKLINQRSNKCAANPQGDVIDQRGCNNNDNQLFTFDPIESFVISKPAVNPTVQPVIKPAPQPIAKPAVNPTVQPIIKPAPQPLMREVTPQVSAKVPLNTPVFIRNKQTGRCLTAEINTGKRYHLSVCNPSNINQKFTVRPYQGDFNRVFAHNPAFVFDLNGQGEHDGNYYHNWPVNNTPAQHFKMPSVDGKYFKLINQRSNKCAANPQGDVIDQRGCNNNDNQLFTFDPIESFVISKPAVNPTVQPVIKPAPQPIAKPAVNPTVQPIIKPAPQPLMREVAPQVSAKVPLNTPVFIRNKQTGRCLTAEINTGKRYHLSVCNPSNINQKFTVRPYQGDFNRVFAHNPAFVFDLNGQGEHDGNYYHNWPVNNTPAQHFKMPSVDGKYFKLINQRSNKCAANPQGDVIDQRGCNNNDNQLFTFDPIESFVISKPAVNPTVQPVIKPAPQPIAKPAVNPTVQPIIKPAPQPLMREVTPQVSAKVPLNTPVFIRNKQTGRCLTAEINTGKRYHLSVCNPSNINQKFTVRPYQGDFNRVFAHNPAFVFDLNGQGEQDGNYYHNWPVNNTPAQHFKMPSVDGKYFKLINQRSNKCAANPQGDVIDQRGCNNNDNQLFTFDPIESLYPSKPAQNPTVQPVIKPAPQPLMREVAPQVSAKVPLNTPVFIRNKQTGRCLTAEINTGKRYHLSECNPSNINQKFTVRPYQGDFNRVFAHNPAFVFDLNGQGEQDGNYYHNWPVNNTPAQHFKMPSVDGKYFKLINQRSNKCAANPQGDVIDQRGCNNNDNQLFNFDPVDSFVISKPAVNPTVQPIIKPAPQPLMREVAPQVSAKVPLNTPVFIRNKQTGRCLTAEINTGKRYHLSVCNPSNINQKFTVRPYQGDFNRVFAHNPAFVFDLNGQGEHDGNYYHNWPVNNTPAQHFKMPSVDGKYFKLINQRSNKCAANPQGDVIDQRGCNNNDNQLFTFDPIESFVISKPAVNPTVQPIIKPAPQPLMREVAPQVNPTVQPVIKPAPQPLMREDIDEDCDKVPLNTPVFIRNKQTGRCLTAEINTGKRYHLSVCNPSNINQKFTVRPYQGDFNRVFAHNPAFVFDLNGQGEQDGNYYHNWPVNNTPAQHFKMPSVDGKYFKLINQRSNKCAANPQGDVIDQRGCNNNDNQLFTFDPIESLYPSKPAQNPTVQPVIKPVPQPLMREVAPQVSAKVPLNTPVFIRNKQTGRCLTAEINTGKRYHLSECNPSNINQKFTVRPFQGDFNRVFAHNPAFVFDLNGQGEHDGNYYHNWPVNNTPAQHFKMPSVDGKYFKLINQRSNKCAANPQGDVIDQRGCNNNDNQLFNFDPVDSFVISKPAVNPTVQPIIKPAPQPLMREVAPQVSAKVPLNTPVFIRNKQTGRCLTAEINTGKRYHLSVCNPSNINQKFTVRPYQGDFNRVFAHNPAFVFDLNGQGEHDGNYYHNWPVNNTPAQHFKMPSVDGKYFKLINQRSNKCAANPQGDVIDQRGCNNNDNQLFNFDPVDSFVISKPAVNPTVQPIIKPAPQPLMREVAPQVNPTVQPVIKPAPQPLMREDIDEDCDKVPLNTPVFIRNKQTGRCLTAEINTGKRYHLSECNPSNINQKFTVRPYQGDFNRVFAHNPAFVFDLNGQGEQDGNYYHNWPVNNTPAQHFKMPSVDGKYFKLINQRSNKCAANPQGDVIDQRGCNNNDNQLFTFDPVDSFVISKPAVNPMMRTTVSHFKLFNHVPLNTLVSIRNKQTGRCLTAEINTGKRYHLAECNPSNINQKFTVRQYQGEFNRIFAHNPAFVFDLNGQGQQDGNYYHNWPVNNTPAQHFKMPTNNGFFKLINQRSNKCTANPQGDVIDQRGCNDNDNQLFFFTQ